VVNPNSTASAYVTSGEIIKDLSESITLNVDSEAFSSDSLSGQNIGKAHVKYSFTISATGGGVGCSSLIGRKTGLEAAQEVVKRRLSALENGSLTTALISANSVDSNLALYHSGPKYMQVRNMDADPINGTLNVTGDLILRPSSSAYPQAFIDISIDSRAETTQVGRTVVISGTVEGLHSVSFNDIINSTFHASASKIGNAESAYQALRGNFEALASAYASNLISDTSDCTSGGLLAICSNYIAPTECGMRLVNRGVTRNFGSGTISFNEEFSTARNCSIPGAAKVDTEVTHTYPTDVIAEFTIPFRGEPLIQNLGTTTKETIGVNVNVTVENPGCDVRDLSGVIGCALSEADALGSSEGAAGWYLTQHNVSKTNTGTLRVSKEWTKPYYC
jgi:hypothetical protein